ncbi:hypothetical protein I6J39_34540 (plasmid) [Streptomyces californicus]|uniref:Uncharacterized protein n=1 Tax=Streptomyces californicus TaxID=67351 RepID=A0ABX7JH63_9ACTN|nr:MULTISPECIES: hypothetical protein [Streptomyces]QRV32477.1 hypothetical protein I6J39_34540 [Streptomyces californicus]QRV45893.1 hypothetical protein I6J41_34465 [Streptomyces californicus]
MVIRAKTERQIRDRFCDPEYLFVESRRQEPNCLPSSTEPAGLGPATLLGHDPCNGSPPNAPT